MLRVLVNKSMTTVDCKFFSNDQVFLNASMPKNIASNINQEQKGLTNIDKYLKTTTSNGENTVLA